VHSCPNRRRCSLQRDDSGSSLEDDPTCWYSVSVNMLYGSCEWKQGVANHVLQTAGRNMEMQVGQSSRIRHNAQSQ